MLVRESELADQTVVMDYDERHVVATIDRALYHTAYEQHQAWNEAQALTRGWPSGRISPEDGWQQYAALVDLCWRLAPEQSIRQRQERLAIWERYFDRLKKLEAWRAGHAKQT